LLGLGSILGRAALLRRLDCAMQATRQRSPTGTFKKELFAFHMRGSEKRIARPDVALQTRSDMKQISKLITTICQIALMGYEDRAPQCSV
jgi:hypothetical protein